MVEKTAKVDEDEMDGIGAGIGRLDNYEDMFKEITRKLYGEDPDHRSEYSLSFAHKVS